MTLTPAPLAGDKSLLQRAGPRVGICATAVAWGNQELRQTTSRLPVSYYLTNQELTCLVAQRGEGTVEGRGGQRNGLRRDSQGR